MRVLLVSPRDPAVTKNLKHLVGGENTYTKTLLENPPRGVTYVYHRDVLKRGLIKYLPQQKFLTLLVKLRILPLSSGTQCLRILDHFDLIHCHGYSIKVEGTKAPVILSDSSSNYLFLRDYLGWPKWRIKIGYRLRGWLFKKLGVIDPDTNLEKASKLIVFSNLAKKIHQKLGVPKNKIEVIYPGLPSEYPRAYDPVSEKFYETGSEKIRILFVGVWFERKGGPIVLEAYRRLSMKYDNLSLTIVGPIPKRFMIDDLPAGKAGLRFKNYDYVPREKLMREIFPKADILVLVPPKVEGFGFAVLEAMSFGILAVASRICALPELVADGKTGFVIKPGSVEELIDKLEILIKNQSLRKKMGEAAKKRFEEKFSIEKSNEELLRIYKETLKTA